MSFCFTLSEEFETILIRVVKSVSTQLLGPPGIALQSHNVKGTESNVSDCGLILARFSYSLARDRKGDDPRDQPRDGYVLGDVAMDGHGDHGKQLHISHLWD